MQSKEKTLLGKRSFLVDRQRKYLTQRSNVANTRSTTCFSIYQLYLKIKDMKIWQQVLAQQMKLLISPIVMILTPRKPLHS